MFIVIVKTFTTPPESVYVFDSVTGHANTYQKLLGFLASDQSVLSIPTEGRYPHKPQAKSLTAIRFVKTNDLLFTKQAPDGALEVAGRTDDLARYAKRFLFQPEGGHHHPEQAFQVSDLHPDTEMIVIEAIPDDEGT